MVNTTTVNTPYLHHNPSPFSIGDSLNPSTRCSVAFQLARWCLLCTVDTKELREKPREQDFLDETFHPNDLCPPTHPPYSCSPLSVQFVCVLQAAILGMKAMLISC